MKKTLNTSALVTADSSKGQRATETFRAQYNKAGLNNEEAQTLNEHPSFAAYLAHGIRRFSAKAPDYSLMQAILGADFVTPEEVMKARRDIVYSIQQITALDESLPSEDVLKWCKDNGYVVIPAPPKAMSTLDILEIDSETSEWSADQPTSNQKFARKDKTFFGWLLIKKVSVQNSTTKTWNEQCKLVSELERIPNAAEVCWFITTYLEVRGVRLFEGMYVRTSSLLPNGEHVIVGIFVSIGLVVGFFLDVSRNGGVGLSVVRK